MNLWQDFMTNDNKIIHKWMHYFPIYEKHLSKFCNSTVTIVEIGVSQGGSLQMWQRFLGPMATIIGIDLDTSCKQHEADNIHIRIGHQGDYELLGNIIAEFGTPDIVIDDGSHIMKDVNSSFEYLYPQLSRNGVYIVEDMHTAYWTEYGGGIKKPDTFINISKNFIDHLNAHHTRGAVDADFITQNTFGISFYDSVIVFERGTIPLRKAPKTGSIAK